MGGERLLLWNWGFGAVCEDSHMPSAAATATDAAAAVAFESVSLGIGLAPTAGPPACAVASPTNSASKPAATSFLGRIDMMGGVSAGDSTHDAHTIWPKS